MDIEMEEIDKTPRWLNWVDVILGCAICTLIGIDAWMMLRG